MTDPGLVTSNVATMTINRPDVRNAVDRATATALAAAGDGAGNASDVHAIVLTGAGGSFCAGADLHALGDTERCNELVAELRGAHGADPHALPGPGGGGHRGPCRGRWHG